STVEPGELVLERKLDAADVAVVVVVDLCRHAADWGRPVPHQAREQVRLRIEIQRSEEASWPASLHDDEIAVADAARRGAAPAGKRLLDLAWKRQLRFEPRAIQLAADQFVLAQKTARCLDPAAATVERPAARRPLRVFVRNENHALIRCLRKQAEFGIAAQLA